MCGCVMHGCAGAGASVPMQITAGGMCAPWACRHAVAPTRARTAARASDKCSANAARHRCELLLLARSGKRPGWRVEVCWSRWLALRAHDQSRNQILVYCLHAPPSPATRLLVGEGEADSDSVTARHPGPSFIISGCHKGAPITITHWGASPPAITTRNTCFTPALQRHASPHHTPPGRASPTASPPPSARRSPSTRPRCCYCRCRGCYCRPPRPGSSSA